MQMDGLWKFWCDYWVIIDLELISNGMFRTFSHYLVRSRLIFSFVNDSGFFLPKRTMHASLLIVERKQQICIRLTKSSLVLMRMSRSTAYEVIAGLQPVLH